MCSNFDEMWHLKQIEHADYELELMVLTQNYRFWQIKSQHWIFSDFYEIWNSQEIKQSKMLILIMNIILASV